MSKVFFWISILLTIPSAAIAAEPAWWTQQKQKCGLSSSLAYNTWVSQGSPCKGGGSESTSSSGAGLGQAIGEVIVEGFRAGTKEAQQEKAAREAEETENARQKDIDDESSKERLLGDMMDVSPASTLQPLSDDDVKSIMPKRRERPKRNPPKAVLKQPTTQTTSLKAVDPTAATPVTPVEAQPRPVAPAANVTVGFTKGFEHGSGCFSQNAGVACSGVAAPQFEACLADYRGGFGEGTSVSQARINLAFRNGVRDRRAGQNTRQDTAGSCSMEISNAYKAGLAGRPSP